MTRIKVRWGEIVVILAILAVLVTMSLPKRGVGGRLGHLQPVELRVAC